MCNFILAESRARCSPPTRWSSSFPDEDALASSTSTASAVRARTPRPGSTGTRACGSVAACRASASVAFSLCLLLPVLPLWRAHRRVLASLAQSAAAKLPLDTLNDPAAAAAAAAAAWAVVRVARAMSAQGMAGGGRVDGDARAAKAATRVAQVAVAGVGAVVAW